MKLITANIKSNPVMSQKRVTHDVTLVSSLGGVILWQEIDPHISRYGDAVKSIGPAFHSLHLNRETPISYRTDHWDLDASLVGQQLMHKGRAHVTPSRYVTWAGLKKRHSTLPPVIFMNTHMISGAFSNKHPFTKKWRRRQWEIHFELQRQRVEEFVKRGITVIGGGDLNRVDMPKYMKQQRWLAVGGIDHLWVCEAEQGVQITLRESHRITRQFYTDHAPRIAELYWANSVTGHGESK